MDVVGAILKGILEAGSTGIYNVAGDGILTMKEMARIMGKPYVALPPGLIKGALWVMKKLGGDPVRPGAGQFPAIQARSLEPAAQRGVRYTPQKTTREVFQFFLECRKSGLNRGLHQTALQ